MPIRYQIQLIIPKEVTKYINLLDKSHRIINSLTFRYRQISEVPLNTIEVEVEDEDEDEVLPLPLDEIDI